MNPPPFVNPSYGPVKTNVYICISLDSYILCINSHVSGDRKVLVTLTQSVCVTFVCPMSHNRIGLPASSLTIGKDWAVVSVPSIGQHWLSELSEHLVLWNEGRTRENPLVNIWPSTSKSHMIQNHMIRWQERYRQLYTPEVNIYVCLWLN